MSDFQSHEPDDFAQPPRRQVRVVMAAVVLLLVAVAIWGFAWLRGQWGGDSAGPTATVTVTSTPTTPSATGTPTPRVQTATPVEPTTTGAGPTPTPTPRTTTSGRPTVTLPPGARACDGTARVRAAAGSARTSCAFAGAVRDAWVAAGKGERSVRAHSSVTDRDYTMTCSGAPLTTCRGGNDAVVYLY